MKMCFRSLAGVLPLFVLVCLMATPAAAAPVIFSASGPDAAAIQGTVDAFRAALGDLNPNNPGINPPDGRREINWDGVPAMFNSPNAFPGDFFNTNLPGRARGAEFTTPGTELQVSAGAGLPGFEFANLNPTYPELFGVFSNPRLFTGVGSNITDTTFFVPGTDIPADVSAFGAVFTDVDLAGTTIAYFDLNDALLNSFAVPAASGNQSLSFLGVLFNAGERVSRVRITSGNSALGPNESPELDLVVMDDFIYSEPQATPLPGTFLLMGTGLAGFWLRRRFMKK